MAASPFSTQRTVALDVLQPLAAFSHSVGLDRPRAGVDIALGNKPQFYIGEPNAIAAVHAAILRAPATPTPEPRLNISNSDPLRVLVDGDSVSGFVGSEMQSIGQARGSVVANHFFKVSSGLERPDFFDWPGQLSTDIKTYNPQVVVFMLGGNDNHAIEDAQGNVYDFGSDGWRREYTKRVDQIISIVLENRSRIVWVGMPVMSDPGFQNNMQTLNGVFAKEAHKYHQLYIDPTPVVGGPGGQFEWYLPGSDGTLALARAGDGVHLTPFGAHLVAAGVLQKILRECCITQPNRRPLPS